MSFDIDPSNQKEFAQLSLQENKPRFDVLAFRVPNCDSDQSDSAAVASLTRLLLWFVQCVACDTVHLTKKKQLDWKSKFALLDVEEHPFFSAILL